MTDVCAEAPAVRSSGVIPGIDQPFSSQAERDKAMAMVVQAGSPVRLKGQNVILLFYAEAADGKMCILPIGTFATVAEAQAVKDELWKKYGYAAQFSYAIGPVGHWGVLPMQDQPEDPTPLVVAHLREVNIQSQTKSGLAYADPRCRATLEAMKRELPSSQRPRNMDVLMQAAAEPQFTAPPLPDEDVKSTPPPPQPQEEDVKSTPPPPPASQEPSSKAPLTNQEKLDAIVARLKSKRKPKPKRKPAAAAAADTIQYTAAQKAAFEELNTDQRRALYFELTEAKARNDKPRLRAIYDRFGPIAVVGQPTTQAPPAGTQLKEVPLQQ
jgi:hypothetical protein